MSASDATDDLSILHPNHVVTVGGQELTVREYGFIEGLKLQPLARPFIDDLVRTLAQAGDDDYELALDVIGRHAEAVVEMVAVAASVDAAWVTALEPADGDLLLQAWFAANSGFFARAATRRAVAAVLKREARPSAGGASTPISSPPATTQIDSVITPSGN